MLQKSTYKTVDELPDLLKGKEKAYNSVDELPDLKKKPSLVNGNSPSQLNGEVLQEPFDPLKNQKKLFTGLSKEPIDTFQLESVGEPVSRKPVTPRVMTLEEYAGTLDKTPVADQTALPKPITQIEVNDKLKRSEQHKANVELAIDNTVKQYFKLKGIKTGTNSPLYQEQKEKVQKAYDEGDVAYHMDLKTNTPRLDKITGWWTGLAKGWNEATTDQDEANYFAEGMTRQERIEYANKKQQEQLSKPPSEYLDERAGGLGETGHFIGGAAPFLLKAVGAAGLGTMAVAAAPATMGESLAALPVAASFLFTANDMKNTGIRNEVLRRYDIEKRNNPNLTDEQAMELAESGELSGGVRGIMENALFMKTMKMPISGEGRKAIGKFATETLQSGLNMGAATAVTDVAQKLEGTLEGYKTTPKEVAEGAINTFLEQGTNGMLLHGLVHGAKVLPKSVRSAFKFALKDVPKEEIVHTLKANEDLGTITPEQAKKVAEDIDGYNQALDKINPRGLSETSQASIAGLIQAKENLKKEAETKDESVRKPYEDKIEAISQQIADIQRTNKPFEHEIDDLTGNTLAKPSFDEVAKQRVQDVADKISKGKEVEDVVDIQTETKFPEQLEKELNKILREEKSANKDKEKPNNEITNNIEKYLAKNKKEQPTPPTEVKTEKSPPSTGLSRGDENKKSEIEYNRQKELKPINDLAEGKKGALNISPTDRESTNIGEGFTTILENVKLTDAEWKEARREIFAKDTKAKTLKEHQEWRKDFEKRVANRLKNEINEKYDAELAALEKDPSLSSNTPSKPSTVLSRGDVENNQHTAGYSTIALDYLFTGGRDVIQSTDYLLQALVGAFEHSAKEIDAIRNKYANKLGNIKDDINSDVYNSMMQEIREVINKKYNSTKANEIFDKILKNATGFTVREGNQVSIELEKLNEQILQQDPSLSSNTPSKTVVDDEKVVKSRVKRIAKSLNVDEQRSQQIHDIALKAKDYEDFKKQVSDLIGDDTVNENRIAEQYDDIRNEAKSEYEKELERNLEDLRAAYTDATKSDAALRKMNESPKSVRGFIKRLLTGATLESVAEQKAKLVEMQRQYRKEKADMRAMLPRERGANFVVEKLSRAARNGDISQEAADLAIDLIRKQPDIFGDLAISITGKKGENDGVQGWYRAADALVKIFKNPSDETTVAHEVLHHTERFLPHEIRDKIIAEWNNEVNLQIADIQKKLKTETNVDKRQQLTQGLLYLGLAQERQVESNGANQQSMERIMSKYLGDHTDSQGNFHKGLGNSWYQLYNPSEWWAVNASRLFREAKNKPELKTWTDKAKAFYNYLIDAVKRIFKGSPTAAVEKGLKAVLNGETLEDREGTQLSASQKLLNIKQKGSFEDKLKSIYDEVNKDKISSSNTPSKKQSTKVEEQTKPIVNEEAKATEVPVAKTETSTPKEQPDKVVPEEGTGEPPKPPKEPIAESEGKDKLNDKGILNHLASAENVPEVSKKGFEEKGLKYNTSSQKEAESVAKSVIDKYGVDDAVLLAEAQKFDGDVNSLIYAETLNRLAKSESEAKTQEEKIEFAKKFAEVGIKYDEAGRKGGRFSSAINYFYKKSPLGVQMIENAKRKEAFEEWSKPKDKSWKEFFDEMMKEPEFEKEVSAKVKEEMKKERAEARQARIKKVDEFFDKAKKEFEGGATYSTIIPPKIITAAIDGMKLAYHGGEKVVKLVQDAIDYISEKLGHDTWDKEKFRKEWESKLKDKAEKKPLTDEEIKTKILERFRKKLKGLTDKEKEEVVRKSFQKIVESGGLDYADFKKIISDITGRGELTEAETTRLKELVKETNLVDEAGEKARLERTQEARKNYFEAQTKAAKASKELNELLYNRPNITRRLTSIMQLNTLGIPALVNNPIYNVWNQTTLRLPVGAVKTVIDQAIKYGSGGKIAPETNIVNTTVQAEFFSKLGLGTKESLQQFFTGLNRADYTAKEIQGQQIRPATAIRDLWAFFKGKKNLTGEQAIDKTLQATVGIPAEMVARTLNLGDKPQRFAAEGAQAAAFAKALGLKDINYDLFIDFPREEAYRVYKEKGLSDTEASKKADYIKDTIIKEGQRSTFQQDNMLNDVINRAFGGEKSGIGSLAKAITISPYIKIPSNAYWSFYNLINPEIAFLQSAIYGAKAAAKEYGGYKKFLGDKYNTSAAKDLNEAKYWFAHAAVGMATRAAIVSLVGAGIARPSNTGDDTKKEREGEQNYEQQGTINVSKLWAAVQGRNPDEVKNGLNVQMRWFGHWGTMSDAVAQKNESMTAEQKEKQKDFMDIAFGGMEIDALKHLNQGVFGNTSSLLTAVERKDFQNYGVNLINMFANIVQPAALAQVEKASMPYYTKQKADTFLGELNNTMLNRSKLYRDLTNQYPPSKIGIWGDKVEKKDNFGMRLFGISRANPDNFAQPIYDDYKKTNNIKFFPPSVRPVIEGNGQVINLPTKDAARLEELVGQQRKNMISPYVNDMATFEGSSKTYSQLTDEEKLDKLNIIYDEGYKNGKELFLKEHPEYIIPEKTKQDKREDKKESRANKKFRKAISSKY